MAEARLIIGDALEVMRSLPAGSVDLLLTSPPYLSLRSYLPQDHVDKAREMGAEPTPGAFIDALLDVTEEARRVLAPHGSLCVELGDTYAGSGGAGGDYSEGGMRDGQPRFRQNQGSHNLAAFEGASFVGANRAGAGGGRGWPMDKSLAMVPESYRWALAYGRNPFTGRETPPWRVRNVIRHFRPNPPVGSLGDKVRPATSEWVVACTSRTRYFDLDAVRSESSGQTRGYVGDKRRQTMDGGDLGAYTPEMAAAGAPPLDWWDDDDLEWRDAAGFIEPTAPYPGAHYATFSKRVVQRLIEPMCPTRVCRTCGEPSRRIVETGERLSNGRPATEFHRKTRDTLNGSTEQAHEGNGSFASVRSTLGWTDCSHDDWRPGLILDPFGGSGTTAAVATGHGRDCILIDLDARSEELARERIGMFLTVEHFARAATA